jgi:hypothetical protein
MGYKLGIMVKKIHLTLILIITCSIYADDTSPKENLKQKVISSSHSFSVNEQAKIYNLNASKNGISINSSRIGIPKSRSLRMFDAPSRSDKYILKVFDEDSNVIRILGLGNPFYIHVQHIDFEDRPIFGGDIDRDFDIPIPLDSDAASISFFEQSEFGLKEISKIQLDQSQ